MKTLMMTALFSGLSTMLLGQNPPSTVKDAFQLKFPNAQSVKWEMEHETEWEAEFKLDGTKYSASFSNEGAWKETEHEVAESSLPSAVKNTLKNEFTGYKIEEAEMIETPKFSGYELELEKGESTWEVVITADGKVLKKNKK